MTYREMIPADIGIDPLLWAQMLCRPFFTERRIIDGEGKDDALAELAALGVTIDSMGGNCPVQIEGGFDDVAFYFRARGDHWEFHVFDGAPGSYVYSKADIWSHDESYGEWPDAGWMPLGEALRFTIKAISMFRERHHG